ncbi:MAG TPA: hypothetical protein VJZ50_02110 [Candidatus Limnocylindrales bacterium]|nr:hypothetical protein [Candidatus Limnocylindrales bacterium]
MSARDRSITLILGAVALIAWAVVAVVVTTMSPLGDAGIQLMGAVALGSAVGFTLWPLLWSASRGTQGALMTAGRRSGLAGLVVSILVVLRALDAVVPPVVLFLVVGAVLVEAAFSLRR